MRALLSCLILLGGLVFSTEALTCRSDGGPKEEQLKTLYMNCLKSQDGRNSTNNRENSRREHSNNRDRDQNDSSSREKRKQNQQGQQWDRKGDAFGNRDDNWSGGSSDWSNRNRDRSSGRDDWGNSRDGSPGTGRYDRVPSEGGGHDRMGQNRDREMNGRGDYMENQDFEGEMSRYNNNFRPSTQLPRRMKREKTSGHRSQYNPNASQKTSGSDYRTTERNSSENNSSKDDSAQACALHCFLEELEMTGENGMPDRYLVTQVLTKDVKNEDLRDFLQESTEECFQILHNENSQDKCEFSKNLMMCLSEKGRANCDDWKDDLKF